MGVGTGGLRGRPFSQIQAKRGENLGKTTKNTGKELKCTKFDFGWGSAPDPAGRAHPDPLVVF